MIFKNELCAKVLNGEKTQTRRLFREGDYTWLAPGSAGVRIDEVCDRNHRLKWQVGQSYAVQSGRGKKAIGRFELLAIRGEALQDITAQDAIAEGWPRDQALFPRMNTESKALEWFRDLWDSINKKPGTRWVDNPPVWTLEFARIDD